jgi:hypothetical protein
LTENLKGKSKRITKTTKTRHYRYSKINPQNAIATFKIDRGNVEQIIQLHCPTGTTLTNNEIPKEKNPNLTSFYFGNMRFTWRTDLKKGAIYNLDGIYCGNFVKHDLKNLFYQIGTILRQEKK